MDEAEHKQVAQRLRDIVGRRCKINGTAGELINQFGYTELSPEVAEYVGAVLGAQSLAVTPPLTAARLDTKVRVALPSGRRGGVPFTYGLRSPSHPSEFPARVLAPLNGSLAALGYKPTTMMEGSAFYVRRYSPVFYILLYIILFPAGLVLLLVRPTEGFSVSWREDGSGSTLAEARGTDKGCGLCLTPCLPQRCSLADL
ncbi:MAG: hypothetical protein WB507_06110 [Solirubrobacterales bacterium]